MRYYTVIVMLVALSVIGGMIKIPSVIGSIALDTAPALVGAVLLGPVAGALIAFVGHLLSAMTAGFPLGPLHLFIAFGMAGLTFMFAVLFNKNRWSASIFFFLGNTFILPLPLLFMMDAALYWTILFPLAISTVLNLGVAVYLLPRLERFSFTKMRGENY